VVACRGVRVFVCAALLLAVATASAAPASDDVVVAVRDRALVEALGDALAPAKVIAVDDVAPSAIGDLTAASRLLVEREHTGAAIWLVEQGGTTTLVAYDRDADRVLVRPIAYTTPLSNLHAAVIARSARAMLRALRVEAQTEQPAGAAPPPVVAVRAPSAVPSELLATTAGLAVRAGAPGNAAIPELCLGAIWRPAAPGLMVDLALAPSSELAGTMFTGSVGDRSLGVVARVPLRAIARVRLAAFGGVAIHAVRLGGNIADRAIADWRFDPAVRVGAVASYAVRNKIDVGFSVSTDNLLRRQRYEVEGEQLVVMQRLQVAAGILVILRVM